MSGEDRSRRSVDLVRNEAATAAITGGQVLWCRAKLLHALADAARQGVLAEVLGELLPEEDSLPERVVRALGESGWLPPGR